MADGAREDAARKDDARKDAEAQVASYFAQYEPAIAELGKTLRTKLRARLPGLTEIVYLYEGQEALLISYSPTEHGYGGVCSLALHPTQVKLHFAHGPELAKSDPKKLLQGTGKTVRHVVLGSVADFERPEIETLIAAALKRAKVQPDPSAKGGLILKADEQKKRASRAKMSTAAAPMGRTPKSRR
jgi:hypothetical protein